MLIMRHVGVNLLLCCAFLLSGCDGNGSGDEQGLRFIPEGEGLLCPAPESIKAYVDRLSRVTQQEAATLLDEGFSLADSLTSANPGSRALCNFSDELARYLDGAGSPYRNARLFEMALDRQQQCSSLEPDDWRKMTFWRERMALNAPGYAVSDIPLACSTEAELPSLRAFCRENSGKTLIFLYGASCRNCRDLAHELQGSSALSQCISSGEITPVAIYTGDDEGEQAAMEEKLPGWKHCSDAGAISFGGAFDTRDIPSLYLVSHNGIVRVRGERDLAVVLKAAKEDRTSDVRIPLLEDERIWGGRVADGKYMPFEDGFSTTLYENCGNQVTPLLLTSKGRYIWSAQPFTFRVEEGCLILENLLDDYETGFTAKNLPGVYRFAMRTFFPPVRMTPPEDFFQVPQYNTWIELQ